MSTPEAWQPKPARSYSWPPFEKGNELSVRHGVWSQRKVDPVAEELSSGLLVDRPDLELSNGRRCVPRWNTLVEQ